MKKYLKRNLSTGILGLIYRVDIRYIIHFLIYISMYKC